MAPLSYVSGATREQWSTEQVRIGGLRTDFDQFDDWRIDAEGKFHGLERVAGVDVSFFPDGIHAVAAIVVLSYPALEVMHERCALFRLSVPYVPGFLAFREVPAFRALLQELPKQCRPQVVFVDGNGAFHPRGCGAATHLGVLENVVTVGVAKEVLQIGGINASVAQALASDLVPGAWTPLQYPEGCNAGAELAAIMRPSESRQLRVVSGGHRISLSSAAILTASLCQSSVVEPVRQADLRSRAAVRAWFKGMPVQKLRLANGGGHGDLLCYDSACKLQEHGLSTLSATPPTASNELVSKRAKYGRSQKTQLVWKPKATPSVGHHEPPADMLLARVGNCGGASHTSNGWFMPDGQWLWELLSSACGTCASRK